MDWAAIITMIIELIKDCRKSQTDEQIRATIRRGGVLVRFRLRQQFRKMGVSLRQIDDCVEDALKAARNSTDQEIDELIAGAADGG